jgi:hypothetical protein
MAPEDYCDVRHRPASEDTKVEVQNPLMTTKQNTEQQSQDDRSQVWYPVEASTPKPTNNNQSRPMLTDPQLVDQNIENQLSGSNLTPRNVLIADSDDHVTSERVSSGQSTETTDKSISVSSETEANDASPAKPPDNIRRSERASHQPNRLHYFQLGNCSVAELARDLEWCTDKASPEVRAWLPLEELINKKRQVRPDLLSSETGETARLPRYPVKWPKRESWRIWWWTETKLKIWTQWTLRPDVLPSRVLWVGKGAPRSDIVPSGVP